MAPLLHYIKIFLLLQFIPFNSSNAQITPVNNTNIHDAVIAYTSDPTAASKQFGGTISEWDTSSITNMSYLFLDNDFAPGFDSDISGWNVGSVTNMNWMFKVRIIMIDHMSIMLYD